MNIHYILTRVLATLRTTLHNHRLPHKDRVLRQYQYTLYKQRSYCCRIFTYVVTVVMVSCVWLVDGICIASISSTSSILYRSNSSSSISSCCCPHHIYTCMSCIHSRCYCSVAFISIDLTSIQILNIDRCDQWLTSNVPKHI
jgi:hypothetical protein